MESRYIERDGVKYYANGHTKGIVHTNSDASNVVLETKLNNLDASFDTLQDTFDLEIQNMTLADPSSAEIVAARGGKTTLDARLDAVDSQLAEKTQQLILKAEKTEVDAIDLRVDNLVIPLSVENSNIQVTDALVSATKVKTFTTIKNRFEEIENSTYFPASNLALNGNFANGITGWALLYATQTTANNVLTLQPTAQYGSVYKINTATLNHSVYVSASVKADSNLVSMNFRKNATPWTTLVTKAHSGSNNYERLSGIGIYPDTAANWFFEVRDTRASAWAPTLIQNMFMVDLTATFGAGNEPSVSEMDLIMSFYPNAWFDGTVNLAESKKFLVYILGSINRAKTGEGIIKASLTGDLIANGTIDVANTNFMSEGKNKYNVDTISVADTWVNYTTGAIQTYPTNSAIKGYHYSAPIKLKPSTTYKRIYGTSNGISFFTSTNAFISGTTADTFTTPSNMSYAIMNVKDGKLYDQLEEGSVTTEYEPYMIVTKIKPDYKSIYQLNLPAKIYALVGREINVYFDNLMIDDASKYNWDADGTLGTQQDERWTATPTEAGTYPLKITAYKDYNDVYGGIANKSASVIVAPTAAGTGQSVKYLQIGDSTTYNMINSGTLFDNFTPDVVDFSHIGTQGTAPNLHEGWPGQYISFLFSSASSPFVFNGVFDFPQYMSTNGFTGVDCVGLHVGINDVFSKNYEDIDATVAGVVSTIEVMITSIHTYNSLTKIGIMVPILPTLTQNGIGNLSNMNTPRWRYKRNIVLLARQLINQFQEREIENIYIVPVNCNLDTVNNMASRTELANARTTTMVSRQINGLHPSDEGSGQMSDSVYYWIKNTI